MPLRPHTVRLIAGFFVALFACSGIARADLAPRWSLGAMVQFSEIILIGRIVDVTPAWDPEVQGIYTYVTVDVGEVLKGSLPERRITLKQGGGKVGDVRFEINGQPAFVPGEQALLFLEVRPRDQTLYTTALWQGKWDVGQDAASGEMRALRFAANADEPSDRGRERRALGSFLSDLRNAISSRQYRTLARQVRARPAEAPFGFLNTVEMNGFALLGPARWDRADSGIPVIVDAQSGGQPGFSDGGVPQILNGLATWNRVGTRLQLAPGRFRNRRCFNSFEGDGHVALAFSDPCDEIDDSGGVLAIGGGFFTDRPTRTIGGQGFHDFLQAGIVFNDSPLASTYLRNRGCFQDTVTHELGHTIGLGHTASQSSIMYPVIDTDCFSGPRGLGAGDVTGLRFIYPSSSAASICRLPSAPRNFEVLRSGTVLKASWDRPIVGRPTGYLISVGTFRGGSNVTRVQLGAVTSVTGSLRRGTYFLRVQARTACGLGPSSNEVKLIVP